MFPHLEKRLLQKLNYEHASSSNYNMQLDLSTVLDVLNSGEYLSKTAKVRL